MERFWNKVKKSEDCWEWTGARDYKDGYGFIHFKGRPRFAHRVSWELIFGEIPKDKVVMHKCDNRLCVKPGHLSLGTISENNKDCDTKGRRIHGEQHHAAKITRQQAEEIRKKYIPHVYPLRKLAEEYEMTKESVFAIIKGKTWKEEQVRESSEMRISASE